ncbi:hypothetical protein HNQ96_005501 [Aminobacter lissarensis]|uniref:IrrE N-terminal-like domain-containing protein n=1 Tax=Aminobacter carboxidus TaxID=376165 RepID=A0A8E2BEC2_9HYPH|nr:ImmA/IrrE family metallo-endopeptidase [Aminobacter lissarensis]MBB6469611.1 hypothetical protein [Aminobacter lissarensis]
MSDLDKISSFLDEVPVNLEGALRALGLRVVTDANLDPDVSGHIRKVEPGRYEIASAGGEPVSRQRFTVAHELGHYILHRNLIGDGINDSTKYRTMRGSRLYNSRIDDVHERQANSFAANILMPEHTLRRDIGWYGTVEDAARAYNVSRSAMRWRLKNLGLYEDVDDPEEGHSARPRARVDL